MGNHEVITHFLNISSVTEQIIAIEKIIVFFKMYVNAYPKNMYDLSNKAIGISHYRLYLDNILININNIGLQYCIKFECLHCESAYNILCVNINVQI